MQPQTPQPPTKSTTIDGTKFIRMIVRIAKTGLLLFASLFGLGFTVGGGVLTAIALQSKSYTAEAHATVTDLGKTTDYDSRDNRRSTTCTPSYTFVVDGKTYTGKSAIGSNTLCTAVVNNTLTIKYDPSSPTKK